MLSYAPFCENDYPSMTPRHQASFILYFTMMNILHLRTPHVSSREWTVHDRRAQVAGLEPAKTSPIAIVLRLMLRRHVGYTCICKVIVNPQLPKGLCNIN